jgi:hypothetical protein
MKPLAKSTAGRLDGGFAAQCSLITEQQDNPENSNKFSETNVTEMSQPKNSEAEGFGLSLKRVWINQAQSRLPDKSGTGRTFL